MKASFKHSLSFLTVFIFIFFGIASSVAKEGMTVENQQIPETFKGYNETLLIIKQFGSWNKYAKKYFEKNYHGKFLMIDEKELTKYSDTEKYRFVLGGELTKDRDVFGPDGVSPGRTRVVGQNLCVFDRKIDKKYCTTTTSLYAKQLEAYSTSLENVRQQR